MASPEKARSFREKYQLPFPLLCDPEQQAYRAFGLTRGSAAEVLGTQVWKRGLKAFLAHGVGRPVGDVWQLPGEFVIDAAGTIQFAHYGESSADNTPVEELLGVLRGTRS